MLAEMTPPPPIIQQATEEEMAAFDPNNPPTMVNTVFLPQVYAEAGEDLQAQVDQTEQALPEVGIAVVSAPYQVFLPLTAEYGYWSDIADRAEWTGWPFVTPLRVEFLDIHGPCDPIVFDQRSYNGAQWHEIANSVQYVVQWDPYIIAEFPYTVLWSIVPQNHNAFCAIPSNGEQAQEDNK